MASLNELANKLQTFIIEQQVDPHNLRQLNIHKYNNLKLKIAQLSYPNVVICIGISEATYNLEDGTKVDGGLGQDERYVLKWLRKGPVIDSLKHLYYELTDLVSLEEEVLMEKQDLEVVLLRPAPGTIVGSGHERHLMPQPPEAPADFPRHFNPLCLCQLEVKSYICGVISYKNNLY